jgi:hypothetical protein
MVSSYVELILLPVPSSNPYKGLTGRAAASITFFPGIARYPSTLMPSPLPVTFTQTGTVSSYPTQLPHKHPLSNRVSTEDRSREGCYGQLSLCDSAVSSVPPPAVPAKRMSRAHGTMGRPHRRDSSSVINQVPTPPLWGGQTNTTQTFSTSALPASL